MLISSRELAIISILKDGRFHTSKGYCSLFRESHFHHRRYIVQFYQAVSLQLYYKYANYQI